MKNRRKWDATYYRKNRLKIQRKTQRWRLRNQERIKAYRKLYHLTSVYGLTWEGFRELKKQSRGCAICHKTEIGKRLCVDHDHKTGRIRGLLCGRCNKALGFLDDSPRRVKQALGYLLKNK